MQGVPTGRCQETGLEGGGGSGLGQIDFLEVKNLKHFQQDKLTFELISCSVAASDNEAVGGPVALHLLGAQNFMAGTSHHSKWIAKWHQIVDSDNDNATVYVASL